MGRRRLFSENHPNQTMGWLKEEGINTYRKKEAGRRKEEGGRILRTKGTRDRKIIKEILKVHIECSRR
jgi:hypothetical protein